MFFIPSVKLNVYRYDEGTNDYGDPVNTRSLVQQGVQAHIYEQGADVSDPSSGRVLTVRQTKAIVQGNHSIKADDVIEDSAGMVYTVDNVIRYYNPFDKAHSELVLTNIT